VAGAGKWGTISGNDEERWAVVGWEGEGAAGERGRDEPPFINLDRLLNPGV